MNKKGSIVSVILLAILVVFFAFFFFLTKYFNNSNNPVRPQPTIDLPTATTIPNPTSPSLGVAISTQDVAPGANPHVPFFAHYYLWWDDNHWLAKLGPTYPRTASPLTLPATLGSDGCTAT